MNISMKKRENHGSKLPPLHDLFISRRGKVRQQETFCEFSASSLLRKSPIVPKHTRTAVNSPLSQSFSLPKHQKTASMPHLKPVLQQFAFPTLTLESLALGKCIGQGSIGRVLLATANGQTVAVKVMQKHPPRLRKIAEAEKQALNYLRHPMIVKTLSWLEDEEQYYLVMEHLPRGDLFKLMKRRRLKKKEVRFYAAEVAVAIRYMHGRKVVYRDLKPENVMLHENGHIKLVDFGFAKRLEAERTGTSLGSPEYMAPELVLRKPHSFSVDCWSFGVLLYELYARYATHSHPPFEGVSPPAVYDNILSGVYDFPPLIDLSAKDLVRRLLTSEVKHRPTIVELMMHEYFRGVNWEAVEKLRLEPPAIDQEPINDAKDLYRTTLFDNF